MPKGSSNRTTQTTNQSTNQTTTPTIGNSQYSTSLQDLLGRIGQFGNQDPSTLVAGPSTLQDQAFDSATGLLSGGPGGGLVGQAGDLATTVGGAGPNTSTAQTATAAGLLDGGLDQYLNPYQSQVTDAYTNDFDTAAGQARAQQSAQAAGNGAFGGSRYGIREAETEGTLARARASGLAGILQGGFDRATSLADADANRRQGTSTFNAQLGTQNNQFNAGQQDQALQRQLQAAGLLGSLGQTQNAQQLSATQLAGQLGGTQRDITQAQGTAGLSQLQALQQLYGNMSPYYLGQNSSGTATGTSTGTTTQNPGLLGTIGQLASAGGSLASLFNPVTAAASAAGPAAAVLSDARLKENIHLIGQRPDGLNLYSYNYIWSPEEQEGVMAQEVLEVRPDAVGMLGSYLTVDYARLNHVQ